MPNEKWLTDVKEFKRHEEAVVHKVYLSAILDLYDRRIVAYIIRDRNNNSYVFDILDAAIAETQTAADSSGFLLHSCLYMSAQTCSARSSACSML